MFHHPDQLMTLATTHMQELKTENDQWQLASKLMQSQAAMNQHQPNKWSALRSQIHHFFHKLATPTWEAVIKPILKAS